MTEAVKNSLLIQKEAIKSQQKINSEWGRIKFLETVKNQNNTDYLLKLKYQYKKHLKE